MHWWQSPGLEEDTAVTWRCLIKGSEPQVFGGDAASVPRLTLKRAKKKFSAVPSFCKLSIALKLKNIHKLQLRQEMSVDPIWSASVWPLYISSLRIKLPGLQASVHQAAGPTQGWTDARTTFCALPLLLLPQLTLSNRASHVGQIKTHQKQSFWQFIDSSVIQI